MVRALTTASNHYSKSSSCSGGKGKVDSHNCEGVKKEREKKHTPICKRANINQNFISPGLVLAAGETSTCLPKGPLELTRLTYQDVPPGLMQIVQGQFLVGASTGEDARTGSCQQVIHWIHRKHRKDNRKSCSGLNLAGPSWPICSPACHAPITGDLSLPCLCFSRLLSRCSHGCHTRSALWGSAAARARSLIMGISAWNRVPTLIRLQGWKGRE